jgi:hypothetical protein
VGAPGNSGPGALLSLPGNVAESIVQLELAAGDCRTLAIRVPTGFDLQRIDVPARLSHSLETIVSPCATGFCLNVWNRGTRRIQFSVRLYGVLEVQVRLGDDHEF